MVFNFGHLLILLSAAFFVVASYAILFSAILPLTGIYILDIVATDRFYKYFSVLLIPTVVGFVVANWTGWQYYRNS